jgi:UDP-N-acetylglucosamine--N-acetylmuramyl-(pentapeptide) pyrophosphoryl-undecaprenol N-acetylglucosamine transferase
MRIMAPSNSVALQLDCEKAALGQPVLAGLSPSRSQSSTPPIIEQKMAETLSSTGSYPQDAKGLRVMIAGGGTGGHLFPGLALAEELASRGAEEIRFVGTEKGVEAREVPKAGYPLDLLQVTGIKGRGLRGLFSGLFRLPKAYLEARALLKKHKPHLVVGVGGYASGPMVFAARMAGIPTAILEQNALPGLTNKILGKLVRKVFISLPEAGKFFSAKKIQLLGNPIRRSIREKLARAASQEKPAGEALSILILGGSQGATALNELLPKALSQVQRPLHIVHQSGAKDEAKTREAYQSLGLNAEVSAFFDNMAERYQAADLLICRAGATTIAELGVVGRPSILIPFPQAADNHQEINALSLVNANAGILCRQYETTPEQLAEHVRGLVDDPTRRSQMAQAAKSVGKPEAAKEIASACIALTK